MSACYYPNAVYFSHYCYKQFKHWALTMNSNNEMSAASSFFPEENYNQSSYFRM
jgi:hypothetical protein